ncbi:MAG TPA: hypothetical protein VG317_07315 [Pseudonocardiaceae bacterium]|nr:hypothetical protein [Pseudonocardiaceae bacterium]
MSIEAIRGQFAEGREQLRQGYEQLHAGEDFLARAAKRLDELTRQHSELVRLAELPQALELIATARTAVVGAIEAVDRFSESL